MLCYITILKVLQMNSNNTTSDKILDISDDDFDRLIDEHFSDDGNARRGYANLLKAQDPQIRQRQKQGSQKRSKNLDYIKKLQSSCDKEQKRLTSLELHKNLEFKKNHSNGIQNMLNDPVRKAEWRKNVEAKRKNTVSAKWKPLQTPDGVFKSKKDAAEYYGITVSSLGGRIKHNPKLYFLITKEQYIELTGLNPWLS